MFLPMESTTQSSQDQILTLNEVADYLRLSNSTIYRLIKDGELPAKKIGGTWRFSKVAIQEWFKVNDVAATD